MKTTWSIVAFCLVLCVATSHGARLERSLKQSEVSVSGSASCTVVNGRCQSTARVSTESINDAARSIASALSTAIAQAEDGADVDASAFSFSQAIARAYARVISSHVLSVYVNGESGIACAYTRSQGSAFASTIAQATSSAFAASSNEYARAAANCFSSAVSSASVTAVQDARYGTCTNYGYQFIYRRLETVGYVESIATAFSSVYTAIRDNNAEAAASCGASGISNTRVTTTITG